MAQIGNLVHYTTSSGQPIEKGNVVVTPISGLLRINLPFYNYVWTWSRPVAVLVEEGGSSKKPCVLAHSLGFRSFPETLHIKELVSSTAIDAYNGHYGYSWRKLARRTARPDLSTARHELQVRFSTASYDIDLYLNGSDLELLTRGAKAAL